MKSRLRRIGLDFDNTIACYDTAFFEVARSVELIPEGPVLSKAEVKDAVSRAHGGEAWTRLQGLVYGPEIHRASCFEGVPRFLEVARQAGWEVYVVSHKTPVPVLGEPWDLHQAARDWIQQNGLFERGLELSKTFFEPTREQKIDRLRSLECRVFVDDLPEVFLEPSFPEHVERWLHGTAEGPWKTFRDWSHPARWLDTL